MVLTGLIAIDDNGCIDSVDVNLIEPQEWVYSVDSIGETCNLSNGQAQLMLFREEPVLLHIFGMIQIHKLLLSAINLETGTYNVTVTDINGCNFTGRYLRF